MSELRDRIAAAALNAYEGHDRAWADSEGDIKRRDWFDVADAVIAALALTIQVAGPDGIVGAGNYRYITRWWTPDE